MIHDPLTFWDKLSAAEASGQGVSFLLFMAVIVLLGVVLWLARRRDTEMHKHLAECERIQLEHAKKIDELSAKYARNQRKVAVLFGMLVSQLGNRQLPAGFWNMVMDDDMDLPHIDLGEPTEASQAPH